MKRRCLSIFLVLCMVLALLPPGVAWAADVKYSGGSGTSYDPYLISSVEDMRTLANSSGDWGKCFNLTADIDLEGSEDNQWTAIGQYHNSGGSNIATAFTGTFDGTGHKISGLYIYAPDKAYWGLFGNVESGTIKNLGVDGSVTAEGYVGGVVGRNYYGTVENCYYIGDIRSIDNGGYVHGVGGVVGYNSYGTVKNCHNTGSVSGDKDVGGVVGVNWRGTTQKCYNTGSVTGNESVGGVVGETTADSGKVENCYNTGSVTGNKYVGGVAGFNQAGTSVKNCHNIGNVTGSDSVGGVLGYGQAIGNLSVKVENCYYLYGTAVGGIRGSDVTGQAESKTAEKFTSGEVAWLLQGTQSTQVWCQTIGTDNYPRLAFEAGKRVWMVTFEYTDGTKEYRYINDGEAVCDIPGPPAGYGWVDELENTFTSNTPITSDVTVHCSNAGSAGGTHIPQGCYLVRVFDPQGNPLPGAVVTYASQSGVTNLDGSVFFRRLTVGEPLINASLDGYITWTNKNSNWAKSSDYQTEIILYPESYGGLMLQSAWYHDSVNLLTETKKLNLKSATVGDLTSGNFSISCSALDSNLVTEYQLWQGKTQIASSADGNFSLNVEKGFTKGGGCFVRVIGTDGRTAETSINLTFAENTIQKETGVSILKDKIGVTVADDVPFLGGSTFNVGGVGLLPVEIKATEDKFYIGFNSKIWPPDDPSSSQVKGKFDEFKKSLQTMMKANATLGKRDTNLMNSLMKMEPDFDLPGGSVKFNVIGYAEANWGSSTATGELYIVFRATTPTLGFTTWVVVVPVTVQISGYFEAKVGAKISYNWESSTFNGEIPLTVTLGLDAFGGVGVGKTIGVGAYGSANLAFGMQLFYSPFFKSIDLTGDLGIKAYLGPFEYKKSFAYNTWHLYTANTVKSYVLDNNGMSTYGIYDASGYSLQNLSYLSAESPWQGDAMTLFSAAASTTLMPLLEDTYRNAQPVMIATDGGLYTTFLRADPATNRIYAVAAKFNGASWTEKPIPLDNNAVLDGAPSLLDNGNIWVAYTRTGAGADTSALLDWAKNQTVVVGTLNQDTLAFTQSASFGGDGYVHDQILAMIDGMPTLVWIESAVAADNDVLAPANNTIRYTVWNGTVWSEAQTLAEVGHPIRQISAGGAGVVCNADTDNDFATTEDAVLTLYTLGGGVTELTTGVSGSVTYGMVPGESSACFRWNGDNCLVTSTGRTIPAEGITKEYAVTNDRIYYSAVGNTGAHLTTALYENASWSAAVTLTGGERYLENLNVVTWNGGDYVLGMDTLATITETDVEDAKNLVWSGVMPSSDLRLDDIDYDVDAATAGDSVPVTLHILNAGDHMVERLVIETGGSAETISCSLKPGDTMEVERVVTCPEKLTEYVFTVREAGMDDFTPDDNNGSVHIGYPDLTVDLREIKIGSYHALEAIITNEGTSTTAGSVCITDSTGQILLEQSFDTIAPGDIMVVTYTTSEFADGDYAASVDCDGGELFSYNNESLIHVDPPSTPNLPEHTHSWSGAWSSDATHHWHECEAAGCAVTEDSDKDGYGAHVYDDDTDATCNTCGHVRTVTPPEHEHTWATAWSNDGTHHWHECKADDCTVSDNSQKGSYGVHIYDDDTDTTCNTCGYVRTVTPPEHEHTWAAAWSNDETHHWHDCEADDCTVSDNSQKGSYGVHIYDDDTDTTCNTCGYVRTVTPPEHEHTWVAVWSNDETHHWHDCEADDCTVTDNSQKGSYGVHVYDDDTDAICNTCGYVRTVTPPEHEHTWAAAWSNDETHHWHDCEADDCTVTDNSRKGSYGVHVYDDDTDTTCNTCGYVRAVTPPEHEHTWATVWNNDETHHWHDCEADGCTVTDNSQKDGYGAHVYDDDTDTTCNTCGYVRTVTPPEHEHIWAAAWSNDETHHWHDCEADGCQVADNSQKDGYGAHVYDDDTDTDCNSCGYIRTVTPPEHEHTWAATWSNDETHHWHDCEADGCTVTDNSQKDGYGAHVYDDDTDTTCNICGYVRTVSGGDTPDTPSNPSSSTGGGSSSNTTTSTTRNPDGSTTTKTENKATGTVTETTKYPDGSQVKVETKKDGTVTTTETDKAGNKSETVAKADGSSVAKVNQKDGVTATVNTDTEGKVEAEVELPAQAVAAAQEISEAITLPIPEVKATASAETAPVVTVKTGSNEPVKVLIPTTEANPGTVAVIVKEDGTEEIVKTSVSTEDGLVVNLPDGVTVKIVDNSKGFEDVPASNWAADAVSFNSARELFFGTSETTFAPEMPMTRAMLMTVLARLDGEDTDGGRTWYEKGVDWAVESGVSDGSNPGGDITREQLVTMLWRYSDSPASMGSLDGFSDADDVSDYASVAMRWAVENGIINGYGDGRLGPKGQATRAQVAQMLKNYLEQQQ